MADVKVTIELEPDQAAGLARLCAKISHDDAMRYLYPHVSRDIRSEQAHQILQACDRIGEALDKARAPGAWPWIETGRASSG